MSYLGIGFNTLIYNTLIYGYGIAEIFELLEDSLTDRIEVAIAFLTFLTFNYILDAYEKIGQIDNM